MNDASVSHLQGAPVILNHCLMMEKLLSGHSFEHLAYRNIDDLIFKRGQAFTPRAWKSYRGRGYRRGVVKRCFANAFAMANSFHDLTYVEGLAYSGFFPVHHAWCVTADGEVVDPTWREEYLDNVPHSSWEYVGLPFTEQFLFETAGRRRIYGILDDPRLYIEGPPTEAIAVLEPIRVDAIAER